MFPIRTLAIVLLNFCMSEPAMAAIKIATFVGKVNYGFDRSGVFGQKMRNLAGIPYKVQFTYDTTMGFYEVSGGHEKISGGMQYNSVSPIVDSILEIDRFQKHFSFSDYYGSVLIGNGEMNYRSTDFMKKNTGISTSNSLSASSYNILGLSSLNSNLMPYDVESIFGNFNISEFDNDLGDSASQAYGVLYSNNVGQMVSISGAVPDLETWLLLSIGFGLSGLTMRGARSSPAIV